MCPKPSERLAKRSNVAEDRLREVVRRGRRMLFQAREQRVKPGRDDKVLTAWNGLMLRSFAEAANALDREDYRQVAVRNAGFLLSKLRIDGRLLRSYRDGRARFNAYLEDYACLIDGLISLYEATFDAGWIREAELLAGRMIEKFRDPQSGGFYFTSEDHESLIHRPKEFYDNATPSGNSVAALALLRLWKLTGRREMDAACRFDSGDHGGSYDAASGCDPAPAMRTGFPSGTDKRNSCYRRNPAKRRRASFWTWCFMPICRTRSVACGTGEDLFLLRQKAPVGGRCHRLCLRELYLRTAGDDSGRSRRHTEGSACFSSLTFSSVCLCVNYGNGFCIFYG